LIRYDSRRQSGGWIEIRHGYRSTDGWILATIKHGFGETASAFALLVYV
jgi:hypothetical protein